MKKVMEFNDFSLDNIEEDEEGKRKKRAGKQPKDGECSYTKHSNSSSYTQEKNHRQKKWEQSSEKDFKAEMISTQRKFLIY